MRRLFLVASLLWGISLATAGEVSSPSFRTWTDASGKHTIEARFLSCDQDYQVMLEKRDGSHMALPATRLSPADQRAVADIIRQEAGIAEDLRRVLNAFEKCKKQAIADLEDSKKDVSSTPDEAKVMGDYQRFYEANPEIKQFEPSSRGRIEAARAQAEKNAKDQIRGINGQKRKLESTIFVPRISFRDLRELADKVGIAAAMRADGQKLPDDYEPKLGVETAGLYAGVFVVRQAVSDGRFLVGGREREREAETGDTVDLCMEGKNLKIGDRISLDREVHYASRAVAVRYNRGPNTTVNTTLLVIEKLAYSVDQLKQARAKVNFKPRQFDPEGEAMRRLTSAKSFYRTNRAGGEPRLTAIVAKFPGTPAATEAQRILDQADAN